MTKEGNVASIPPSAAGGGLKLHCLMILQEYFTPFVVTAGD
jgi:hypothetical protein